MTINMIKSVNESRCTDKIKQNTVGQRKGGWMEDGIQDTILKYLCDFFESPLGF